MLRHEQKSNSSLPFVVGGFRYPSSWTTVNPSADYVRHFAHFPLRSGIFSLGLALAGNKLSLSLRTALSEKGNAAHTCLYLDAFIEFRIQMYMACLAFSLLLCLRVCMDVCMCVYV